MEAFNATTSWQLSSTLWIKGEIGQYGPCMKILRTNGRSGSTFIVYTINQWSKIRREIPIIKTKGYTLTLTNTKDIQVVSFHDERYISFHCTFKGVCGGVNHSYVNMNNREWSRLLKVLGEIDKICPVDDILKCMTCVSLHRMVQLHNDRMQKTLLSEEAFKDVYEHNIAVSHHKLIKCEYCSRHVYTPSTCHCHRFDCHECEPENHCSDCGILLVTPI